MRRVIHTGQALVDEVVTIDALPARGDNAMASSWGRFAGGAVNILVAASRNGATAVHAGAIGAGPNGDLVRAALDAEDVTASAPPVGDLDTGVCFVMVEPSAERTFVTTQGAERRISVESLQTSDPRPGDIVCVTGYSLAINSTRDPLLAWLDTLLHGVEVVLDPGAAFASLPASTRERMLARTTVFTGNADEARALSGVTGMVDAAAACVRLLPTDAVSIVRDGPEGCAVTVGNETRIVPGYPQKPVDTNGAGDCHTGVLVAGMATFPEHPDADDWARACRRANAAAAIKVTRSGPATSPTASDVDAFLAANPPTSTEH